jgi:hypothetical protein
MIFFQLLNIAAYYVVFNLPHQSRQKRQLWVFNECCLMLLFYMTLLWSQWGDQFEFDVKMNHNLSMLFLSIVIFVIIPNLFIPLTNALIENYHQWKAKKAL